MANTNQSHNQGSNNRERDSEGRFTDNDNSSNSKNAGSRGHDNDNNRSGRSNASNNPGNFANRSKEDVREAASKGGQHSHGGNSRADRS